MNMDYGLRVSEETGVASNNSGPSKTKYLRADPQLSIGGSLSYLYSVSAKGLELQKRPGDRNTFLDLYAEYRIKRWPCIGVGIYGTSPYLQYELLRSFEYLNLSLSADPVRSSTKGWFKQVGGQVSVAWRSVLWEGYAGAGGLPIKFFGSPQKVMMLR